MSFDFKIIFSSISLLSISRIFMNLGVAIDDYEKIYGSINSYHMKGY